ncbi:DUF21 domain-containing protein [Candidatus Similichlamydia epinepheli]|uniref:DUF21 domain-containing protein n=1 Tax=Candidatus Similichlamydia epinepheli TaxID=1903953 RepID=UPI000D3B53DA|nr:CNNM domain-containing protein [Candidatus Similichlamydia epinepheli]
MQLICWLFLTILMLVLEGFFSMQEVAIVSYDPLLLNYQLHKKNIRAQAVHHFIRSPQSLFTTTLILIEFALHFGSECAKNLFKSIGVPLQLIPFVYIPIVVIFGELSPLFMGRRFPHVIAQFGVVVLVPVRYIVSPFSFLIGKLIRLISFFSNTRKNGEERVLLQREDIFLALRENSNLVHVLSPQGILRFETKTLSSLRKLEMKSLARSLMKVPLLFGNNYSHSCVQNLLQISLAPFLLCFSPEEVLPRLLFPARVLFGKDDLILFQSLERSRIVYASSKPFSSSFDFDTLLTQNDTFFLVLDSDEQIVGWLSLSFFFEELFGGIGAISHENQPCLFERTAPGSMTIRQMRCEFRIGIQEADESLTLSELLEEVLGRHLKVGDSYYFEQSEIELVVQETTRLAGAKTILLRYRGDPGRIK